METSPLLSIVVSLSESCIPGMNYPIAAVRLQCAVSPGMMSKQMLISRGTWHSF